MNINKTFRLDTVASSRLENMSKNAKISQTQLLEELISACFDEACENYSGSSNKGFFRFLEAMKYRLELNNK